MKELIGKMVLVTVDNWFYGPDAKMYRAVYGKLNGIVDSESVIGIKPARGEATWCALVGNTYIAGCQIKYAIQTDECDCNSSVAQFLTDYQCGYKTYETPNPIYFAGR